MEGLESALKMKLAESAQLRSMAEEVNPFFSYFANPLVMGCSDTDGENGFFNGQGTNGTE